ncbi:MAG: helix-turn-helix domain-containing protein [Rhodospirillales bacterium]
MTPEYFTRAEAAEYLTSRGLPVSKCTLQKWATVGGGPVYRIFGIRALYTPADLDDWAEEKLSAPRRSTSETVAA